MTAQVVTSRPTIVDHLTRQRSLAQQIAFILGGSLLLALLAQVRVLLPFTPVPITGQTYGVLLVGALLGSRRGAASLLLYLTGGGLGLPVFQGATAGWGVFASPTGGYLLGFALAAVVVGWLAERGWDRRVGTAIVAMLLGEVAIYLIALPCLSLFVGARHVVALGLIPFLPGDTIKVVLAALTLPLGWRLIRERP